MVCFEYLKKFVCNFGLILIGIEISYFDNLDWLCVWFEEVGIGYCDIICDLVLLEFLI